MQSHSKIRLDRIATIDVLRGLAALAVLIYHARSMFWVGNSEIYHKYGLHFNFNAWLGYATTPFSLGNLGVVLFFVLSGYCIHRRGAKALAVDPAAKIQYRGFFVRRFWRIYPTYLAAMLLTAGVDWWIHSRTGIHPTGQDNSPFAFCMSLLTMQGYFAKYFGSNGVFWTLAMEVHLYLAYPLLFLLSKRSGPRFALGLTLAVGIFYLILNHYAGIEKRLPYKFNEGPVFLPYWFSWTTGFYLAEIEAGRIRDFSEKSWSVMMTIGIIIGLFLTLKGLRCHANIPWAVFFAGLVRASLKPRGQALLSGAAGSALAFVGVFSYSLYAVHVPILECFHVLMDPLSQRKIETLWPAFATALGAILFSWVFFRLVEYWSLGKKARA